MTTWRTWQAAKPCLESWHGGNVMMHLPPTGIRGNSHFPFSDLNKLQIADLMSAFLASRKLD